MDLNTCYEIAQWLNIYSVAYYTHLFPFFVGFFIAIYVLVKTKYSLLSKIFFLFTASFNVWILFDLIAWVYPDYNAISFVWSLFDYFNIIFFLLGLYFFIVLLKQKDVDWKWKIVGIVITLPAAYMVATGISIREFNQAVCESINNDFLVAYKNYVEAFVIICILYLTAKTIFIQKDKMRRNQALIVATAILLFFATFAGTDYFSAQTGIYEIGLYGLFVMPVFLGLIVYSIVKYKAFNVAVLGAQALVATLTVLIGAQFFFIQNFTNQVLNAVTFLLAIVFGYFLVKGVKRELAARIRIEKLATELQQANSRLKELDQQKTEFISLATHQIRGPLGSIKGYASLALEGDYGPINDGPKKAFETILHTAQSLVVVVNDYLDVSRIEQGRMKYDFTEFDLKDLAKTVVEEFMPTIADKKLTLDFNCDQAQTFRVHADSGKIKQVLGNLVDNSIKYTDEGHIRVSLEKKNGKILFSVKDTGIGMKAEVIPNLFAKFSRAPDASRTNIMGTGLGLFVARKMIETHKGRVWGESEGKGKGSQFYVELEEKK